MKTRLFPLLAFVALFFASQVDAQDRIIHGMVTTFDSIPLIDAEVKNRSTRQVVLTDSLGRFSIPASSGDKIKVKAQGFYNEKFKPDKKTRFAAINLQLKPGEKNREYAVGYSKVSDKDKLNALANLNKDDLDFSHYSDLFELIEGRFAGVRIMNGEIIIRGINSINSSSAALIILDGMAVNSSALRTIPPAQVKNIDIIKDGGAAIYGTRGANGVVIIETRDGKD